MNNQEVKRRLALVESARAVLATLEPNPDECAIPSEDFQMVMLKLEEWVIVLKTISINKTKN
jgi:hypothetical protein